ncbi:MAG: hypothetical protein ABJF88_11565 [Rhodothermales bacterium]
MRTLAALSLLLTLPACSLLGLDDEVPFTNVPQAEWLRLPEAGTAVFNDAASWEAFWYDHTSASDSEGNPIPPPEIDFADKTAAAAFLGGGMSGCSNLARLVRSVSLDDDTAVVRVGRLEVEGGVTCDMLISPVHVVTFEKAAAVRFVGEVPR